MTKAEIASEIAKTTGIDREKRSFIDERNNGRQ